MKKILILLSASLFLFTSCVNLKTPPAETKVTTDANTTITSGDTDSYIPDDTDTGVPDDTDTTVPDGTDTTQPHDIGDEPLLNQTLYTAYFVSHKNNLSVYNPTGETVSVPYFDFYSDQRIQEENIPDYKITVDGVDYIGKYEYTVLDTEYAVENRRYYFCDNVVFSIAPDSIF